MKPTGFIEEKQTSDKPKQPFEVGDWVVCIVEIAEGKESLLDRIGIVTDEGLRVCWFDSGSLSAISVNSFTTLRHATAEELAMFNLKAN